MIEVEIYNILGVSYGVPVTESGDDGDHMYFSQLHADKLRDVLLNAPNIAPSGQIQINSDDIAEIRRRAQVTQVSVSDLQIEPAYYKIIHSPLPAWWVDGDTPVGLTVNMQSSHSSVNFRWITIQNGRVEAQVYNSDTSTHVVDMTYSYQLGRTDL